MDAKDLENRFTYHPPHERQAARYYLLRTEVHKLARLIDAKCPDSREKSLAITHLEETVMWANAAIARHREEAHGYPTDDMAP